MVQGVPRPLPMLAGIGSNPLWTPQLVRLIIYEKIIYFFLGLIYLL